MVGATLTIKNFSLFLILAAHEQAYFYNNFYIV